MVCDKGTNVSKMISVIFDDMSIIKKVGFEFGLHDEKSTEC